MFERSEFSSLQRLIAIFKGKIYMGIVSLVRFFAIKEMNILLTIDLALNIIKSKFSAFYFIFIYIPISTCSFFFACPKQNEPKRKGLRQPIFPLLLAPISP